MKQKLFISAAILVVSVLSGTSVSWAEPSYHLIGWLNTFVPGSGRFLMGENGRGALEASVEITTFGIGYSLSPLSPMTIDGVPVSIPNRRKQTKGSAEATNAQFQKGLYAEWLQVFGLKAHMTNTFLAYRDSGAPGVDLTPTKDLFLAPFAKQELSNPWVYWGLLSSFATVALDCTVAIMRKQGVNKHARLTTPSLAMYDTTAIGLIPLGSGAPEEMFYRGFLQNEMLQAFSTPYAAIPVSTTAYALSHQSGVDQWVAAMTGFYLGLMTYQNEGRLSPGIAYHYWSDIFVGIESAILMWKGQPAKPIKLNLALMF